MRKHPHRSISTLAWVFFMSALFEGVTQKFSFYENPYVAPPKGGAFFEEV